MPIDYDAAASLNPYFASVTVPPWNASFNEVKTVLGLGGTQPTAKDFADAVHGWQIDNCRTRDDGILDQTTWDALRPHTMFCVEAEPLPTWLADFGVPLDEGDDVPLSGQIPVTGGIAAVVRIPVPGNGKLGIEFFPRNFKGDSTSTLFIQNIKGNKTLRLDYGYNKAARLRLQQDLKYDRLSLEPERHARQVRYHRSPDGREGRPNALQGREVLSLCRARSGGGRRDA